MNAIVTKKEIKSRATSYSAHVLGINFVRTSKNKVLARTECETYKQGMSNDYIGDAENKQDFVNAIYEYINTYLPNHTTHFA